MKPQLRKRKTYYLLILVTVIQRKVFLLLFLLKLVPITKIQYPVGNKPYLFFSTGILWECVTGKKKDFCRETVEFYSWQEIRK
jgi:hypothetical protein